MKQEKVLQEVVNELNKIQEASSDKKIEKILNHVRKELFSIAQ